MQYNSKHVGTYLLLELAKLRDKFECVGDVRGKGLLIGLELVKNKSTCEPLGASDFVRIWEDCKTMGVLIGRGGFNGNVSHLLIILYHIMHEIKIVSKTLFFNICNSVLYLYIKYPLT